MHIRVLSRASQNGLSKGALERSDAGGALD